MDNKVCRRADKQSHHHRLVYKYTFPKVYSFGHVLVADDDSFINLHNAMELLDIIPQERIYMGNMIDTIPQRWDDKNKRITPEYSVNLYFGNPGKVPVFAHGVRSHGSVSPGAGCP